MVNSRNVECSMVKDKKVEYVPWLRIGRWDMFHGLEYEG